MASKTKKKPKVLKEIYKRLYKEFGPQYWWPARTPLETAIGAILTQNTAWENVEKAIQNLKAKKVLNLSVLHKIKNSELSKLIKPAGFFNVKTKRLRSFLDFLKEESSDNHLSSLRKYSTDKIRQKLLDVSGIGPETADSILLYALNRPVFVVDAYTKRILSRHGLCFDKASYDEIQRMFRVSVRKSTKLYNEYHALLVVLAKKYCRTKAQCGSCPLSYLFTR